MADLIELDLVVRDKGLKQSVSTVERLERQLIKAAKAVEQNRISQDRYNKILLQSKREYQALGMSSQKATAQVRKFAEAQREAGRAAEYHQQQVGFAGKKVNRMGMQMQQAGYQVGDFAVQLQGGTNAAVALGQQGAQLLGIFGPAGAIAGAALAITTAFIAPLLSARKAAQDFVEELKEVTKELDLLRSGAASAGTLSLNQQIADTMNEIYDLENKTIDLRYAGAKTQAEILAIVVEHNKEEKDGLKLLQDKLRELLMAKDAIQIINGLMGDQVSEAENLREVERYNNQQRIAEQKELYKVAQKEASRRSKIREADNASYAKDTLNQIKQWHSAYVKETERVEDESRDRRRDKEEAYIKDMAAFFLAAQERNRKLYYAQFSAEDALMSQDVVSGSIADRFGVSDLLNMGYTKEYLIAIGKMTDETKELEDGLTDAEKAAEKLREELEAPMVNAIESVSNAFGDFISNGLRDFKSFASSIVDSFKSMIAQMIATAARNKIMLSMGLGGSGFAAQAAAGNVAGVGGNSFGGPLGSMMGSFGTGGGFGGGTGLLGGIGGIASGMSGIFSGGGLSASFANLGGLMSGSVGGMGAIGAALPALGAVAVVIGLLSKKTKLLDSGLRTTVEGFDVAIETFKKTQSSRLFGLLKGSKKTSYEAASAEVADPLIEAIGNMQQSIVEAAGTLGIGASAFDDFSYQFKLSLKGLSEEEQLQKINEEITKMGDSFASLTGHFETMNELLAVAQQRYNLNTRLLQLQGNTEELLRRQREAEMEATHELNKGLLQSIYALEDSAIAANKARVALDEANAALSELEAVLNAANSAYEEASRGVESAASAVRQAMETELSAASDAIDAAQDNLERAVAARVDSINASFDTIFENLDRKLDIATDKADASRTIFNLLDTALRDRRLSSGTTESSFASRRTALSYISGGGRDEDKLEDAFSVISEPSEGLFGSFVDYARDFAKTSLVLQESKEAAEATLTADEKAVVALEDQIRQNEELRDLQIENTEAILKTEEAVISVEAAIQAVKAAQSTYDQVEANHNSLIAQFPILNQSVLSIGQAINNLASAQSAQAAAAKAQAAAAASVSVQKTKVTAAEKTVTTADSNTAAVIARQVADEARQRAEAANERLQAARDKAEASRQNAVEKAAAAQAAKDKVNAMLAQMGRPPMYAQGGYHTGGLRMVGERGPEIEATGPSRIFSHNQTASMFKDPELVAEVRNLRSEVSGLRSEQRQMQASNVKYVKRNYDINRKWDTDGLPATRTS